MSHLGDRCTPGSGPLLPQMRRKRRAGNLLTPPGSPTIVLRRVQDEPFSPWPGNHRRFTTIPVGVSRRRNSPAVQSFLCDAALRTQLGSLHSGESPCHRGCLRARAFLAGRWVGLSPSSELGGGISRSAPPRSYDPVFLRFAFCPILLAAVLRSRSVVQAATRSLIFFSF